MPKNRPPRANPRKKADNVAAVAYAAFPNTSPSRYIQITWNIRPAVPDNKNKAHKKMKLPERSNFGIANRFFIKNVIVLGNEFFTADKKMITEIAKEVEQ